VVAAQLRDLRSVIRWLQTHEHVDGKRLALWGDSFAKSNPAEARYEAPLDAPNLPLVGEPLGDLLALLAGVYEDGVRVVYTRGGIVEYDAICSTRYPYVPHDVVVPGFVPAGAIKVVEAALGRRLLKRDATTDTGNWDSKDPTPLSEAIEGVVEKLKK
jgi:hypothetical protein